MLSNEGIKETSKQEDMVIASPSRPSGAPRRVAVLGLPTESREETLREHFSQFGTVEQVEVLREKHSQRSRGFAFVQFQLASAAQEALQSKHKIDGKNCDVKVAHPKQCDLQQLGVTRIFVAKIPPQVSELEFKEYFEQFGDIQDSYMPLNQSKQAFRGIGFVTYSTSQSVERVMERQHRLHGVELAVDRAAPKDDLLHQSRGAFQVNSPQSTDSYAHSSPIGQMPGLSQGLEYQGLQQQILNLVQGGVRHDGIGGGQPTPSTPGTPLLHALASTLPFPMSPLGTTRQQTGSGSDPGSARAGQGVNSNPVLANARAGPRIFVGKLSKDVSEVDVKEYFTKYGYVLDVYLPKSKDNKLEHRGFGFVTFETDAAVQRVVAQGTHKIKGSNIAIDVAVPRREELGVNAPRPSGGGAGSRPSPMSPALPPSMGGMPSPDITQLLQQLQLNQIPLPMPPMMNPQMGPGPIDPSRGMSVMPFPRLQPGLMNFGMSEGLQHELGQPLGDIRPGDGGDPHLGFVGGLDTSPNRQGNVTLTQALGPLDHTGM